MNYKTTLVALAIFLGLFAYIFFWESKKEALPKEVSEKRLFTGYKSADVKRMELRGEKLKDPLVFEKDGDTWKITSPIQARADQATVTGLLSRLEWLDQEREIAGEGGKPLDFAALGLDKPRAELKFQWQGKERVLALGGDQPVGNAVNIRLDGEPKARVVASSLRDVLLKEFNDFRDKTILDVATFSAKGLELKAAGATVALAKGDDDRWRLTQPVADRADKDKVEETLRKLTDLRAESFVEDQPKDLAKYGLDQPQVEASVFEGADKTQKTLLLGGKTTEDKEKLYAMRKGGDSVVAVRGDILASLTKPALDFRDKRAVRFEVDDVKHVEVKAGDQLFEADKDGWEWKIKKPKEAKGHADAFRDFLTALKDAEVDRWFEGKPEELEKYGLKDPRMTITASWNDKKKSEVLLVGKKEDQHLYVKREKEDPVLGLKADLEGKLAKGFLDFRERKVLTFTKPDVQEVTVARDTKEWMLEKDPGGWMAVKPVARKGNATAVDDLLYKLSDLSADALLTEDVSDLKKFGLDAPAVTVHVRVKPPKEEPKKDDTEKPKTEHKLLIGSPVAGKETFHAMLEGTPLVFEVKKEVVEAARKELLHLDLLAVPREKIKSITLTRDPLTVEIVREGNEPKPKNVSWPLDRLAYDDLTYLLSDLKARDFVMGDAAAPGVACTLKVQWEKPDGEEERTLTVGRSAPGQDAICSLSGEPLKFTLGPETVVRVDRELLKKELLEFNMNDLTQIEWFPRGGAPATLKKSGNDWVIEGAASGPADPIQVVAVQSALARLRADRMLGFTAADATRYALDKASADRIQVTWGATTKELWIGGEVPGGGRAGKLDGQDAVFLLGLDTLKQIQPKPEELKKKATENPEKPDK